MTVALAAGERTEGPADEEGIGRDVDGSEDEDEVLCCVEKSESGVDLSMTFVSWASRRDPSLSTIKEHNRLNPCDEPTHYSLEKTY